MDKQYCVYCHEFPNGKKYIGISSDHEKRFRNGKGYKTQKKVYRAIQKYGWDNIEHKVLVSELSKEQAEQIEQSLIEIGDTINNGYNIALGGDKINATYLNNHVLFMIRESKKYDNLYGSVQLEDDIVSIAEKGKYNKRLAKLINTADEKIESVYNEYKRYKGISPVYDLGERRIDCYWWTMAQLVSGNTLTGDAPYMQACWRMQKDG